MTSDEAGSLGAQQQPLSTYPQDEVNDVQQLAPVDDDFAPTWENAALEAAVLIDEDTPHASVLTMLVGDLEGRLGSVYLELGPLEVRALLRQLEDVQLAQQVAEWKADGNDVEDFPLDGVVRGARAMDRDYDDDYDYDEVPSRRGVERLTDPLSVKTLMEQDYRVLGIPVKYLLVGLAVFVGLIVALVGALT